MSIPNLTALLLGAAIGGTVAGHVALRLVGTAAQQASTPACMELQPSLPGTYNVTLVADSWGKTWASLVRSPQQRPENILREKAVPLSEIDKKRVR